MIAGGLVFVGLAAVIHVYIWILESFRWTSPSTRRTFGVRTSEDAETMKALAFNQGFYNLFLALIVIAGIIFHLAGEEMIGTTLIYAGAGSMLLAAVVLAVSSPGMFKGALIQGLAPLCGIVALAIGTIV